MNCANTKQYTKEDVEQVNCPFCQGDAFEQIFTEHAVLGIVRCRLCNLIYVNPRLKSPEKIYWADSGAYYQEAELIFKGERSHHRDKNYLDDLRIIKKYKPKGNFLDIGTNAGFFLRLAKKNKDWQIFGIEPSKSLADLAREHFDLNIENCFLENCRFPDNFFDIITMSDVFEHLPNPKEFLSKARRLLKDEGILFIKVPNGLFNLTKFKLAGLTGRLKSYDIFDSYEHLVHYSHHSLIKMLEASGFKIIYRGVGRPIQTPVWQRLTGQYYQYPSPWRADWKRRILRNLFYFSGLTEYYLRGASAGYLAPNIVVIAQKG